MNTFNQRLLAGAAGLLAAGGALAADLPSRKSAPVEYVKVCDVYGRGFFYIPGTDTCLKIGGRVRAQYSYIGKGNAFSTTSHSVSGGAGATTPGTMNMTSANGRDQLGRYARGHLRMDARTQSAWGTVQTVIDMRVESRSGHLGNGFNTFVQTNQVNPTLVAAYIRFAGFTFGRADQNFVFMPSGIWGSKFHGDYSSGVKQLAYTATFGGGFSATIALEDMRDYEYDRIGNLGGITGGAFERGGVRGTNGPSRLPSLVGNLRLDQGWGTIQAMGAVMQQTANLTAPNAFMISNNNGPLVTKTAYAAGLGVKINLPMLAKGDALWVTGGYAKGAIGMLMEEFASAPGSKGNLAGLQRRDTGMTLYGVGGTAAAGPLAIASELTQAWQIAAMLRHYWTPSLRSHFHVSYVAITPGTQTQNTDWTKGGLSKAKAFATTANLIWSPVSGFDIGVELGYLRLRQNLTGDNGGAPSALPAVAIANGFKTNVNGWEGRLRIQRDF